MDHVRSILFLSVLILFTGCMNAVKTDLGPLLTDHTLGSKDAKITMEVYSDYQCPGCSYFEQNVFPLIRSKLIDTGKVKYIYHDFPIHQDAWLSAESTYCAGDQQKYWEMGSLLFQHIENQAPAALKDYAKELNLNADAFAACLNGKKYKTYVEQLHQQGVEKGIAVTPSVFINGNLIKSDMVPSYDDIQNIIDSLNL